MGTTDAQAGDGGGGSGPVEAGPPAATGGRLPPLHRWAEDRNVATTMAVGLFVGAGWGIIARAWMRLISERPEFSWSGTLYVVGAPAVIGAVVALAHVAMARQWRAARVVRVPAALVHVLLGMGAGVLLLPTIVFGSLALARRRYGVAVRVAIALVVLGAGLPAGAGETGSGMVAALVAVGVVVAVVLVVGWRTRAVLGTVAVLAALGVSSTILASDVPVARALLGSLCYLPLVGVPTLSAASVLRPARATAVSGMPTESVSGAVA